MDPTITMRSPRSLPRPDEREFQSLLRHYEVRERVEGRVRTLGGLYLAISRRAWRPLAAVVSAVVVLLVCATIWATPAPSERPSRWRWCRTTTAGAWGDDRRSA